MSGPAGEVLPSGSLERKPVGEVEELEEEAEEGSEGGEETHSNSTEDEDGGPTTPDAAAKAPAASFSIDSLLTKKMEAIGGPPAQPGRLPSQTPSAPAFPGGLFPSLPHPFLAQLLHQRHLAAQSFRLFPGLPGFPGSLQGAPGHPGHPGHPLSAALAAAASAAAAQRSQATDQPHPASSSAHKAPPLKKYKCDMCGKAFSRSNTLITHKRIHTGEKPFKCEHCGRAFRQPGNLTRHRLTHTTVKPYICGSAGCGKAFNRASNLHTHMRTHSAFRPFVCPYCAKGFHQKIDMKIHVYTHTGIP